MYQLRIEATLDSAVNSDISFSHFKTPSVHALQLDKSETDSLSIYCAMLIETVVLSAISQTQLIGNLCEGSISNPYIGNSAV
jgi:hypothetical protein